MRLTPDYEVVELLKKSPMRDAIKCLGEVEDHKVHLPLLYPLSQQAHALASAIESSRYVGL